MNVLIRLRFETTELEIFFLLFIAQICNIVIPDSRGCLPICGFPIQVGDLKTTNTYLHEAEEGIPNVIVVISLCNFFQFQSDPSVVFLSG